MKIAIFSKDHRVDYGQVFFELYKHLMRNNISDIYIYHPFRAFLQSQYKLVLNCFDYSKPSDFPDVDFLITIGGDGTMLEAITFSRNKNIPIIGINSGRLGFLADIPGSEIADAIDCIVNLNYKIEERSLLEVETSIPVFGDFNFAFNELTIHKKESSSLITIKVLINGEYLNSYWADGLIISTPTGSTAYSMSLGGPIVSPNAKNIIITPIASHNLTVRPFVISDESEIELHVSGRSGDYLVSLDSRSGILCNTDVIKVRKADFSIKLLKLCSHSYFTTLRNKLMWGADVRN